MDKKIISKVINEHHYKMVYKPHMQVNLNTQICLHKLHIQVK